MLRESVVTPSLKADKPITHQGGDGRGKKRINRRKGGENKISAERKKDGRKNPTPKKIRKWGGGRAKRNRR